MRFLKKPWMILMIITIAVALVFLMKDNFTKASPLPKEEIYAQLAAIYDSDVENLTLHGNTYEATLFKDGAEYTVQANAKSGKVLSLEKTKEAPPEKKPEADVQPPTEEADPPVDDEENNADKEETEEDEEITDKNLAESDPKLEDEATEKSKEPTEKPSETEDSSKEKPTTLISEEEAAQIGLASLPEGMTGEIDDIDFKESTEGGYYLVEVEIDRDDADEVVFQIHAISGEVISETWDD